MKLLCRDHYNKTGTHKGFEFSDSLEKKAKDLGTDPVTLFYSYLGYTTGNGLTAEHRHEVRKLHAQKENKKLQERFRLKSVGELNKVLMDLDAFSAVSGIKKPSPEKGSRLDNIKVLARYWESNTSKTVGSGKDLKYLGEYIATLKAEPKLFIKHFDSVKENLSVLLKNHAPVPFLVSKNPRIEGSIFKTTLKMTPSQYEKLMDEAIDHLLIRSQFIPKKVYMFMLKNSDKLFDLNAAEYMTLVDYANLCGVTVQGLYDLCDMVMPDASSMYKMMNVLAIYDGKSSVKFYSEDGKNTAYLSQKTLISLIEQGVVQTLFWDEDGDFSYKVGNSSKKFKAFYGRSSNLANDFREVSQNVL